MRSIRKKGVMFSNKTGGAYADMNEIIESEVSRSGSAKVSREYNEGLQAGADAARRECAEIARASSAAKAKGVHGEGWNNALAYVEEVILARIGKPVDINRHHESEGE